MCEIEVWQPVPSTEYYVYRCVCEFVIIANRDFRMLMAIPECTLSLPLLQLLSQQGFLQGLMAFPKDTINEEMVELLAAYQDMEDYTFATACKVCGDVAGLLSWTRAMVVFYGINKEVLPLKVRQS